MNLENPSSHNNTGSLSNSLRPSADKRSCNFLNKLHLIKFRVHRYESAEPVAASILDLKAPDLKVGTCVHAVGDQPEEAPSAHRAEADFNAWNNSIVEI
jgi:hypothetical protein